jgi:hypothetical protein
MLCNCRVLGNQIDPLLDRSLGFVYGVLDLVVRAVFHVVTPRLEERQSVGPNQNRSVRIN